MANRLLRCRHTLALLFEEAADSFTLLIIREYEVWTRGRGYVMLVMENARKNLPWLEISSSAQLPRLEYWVFFFSSRRRHTRSDRDWSSDVCSSDLVIVKPLFGSMGLGMVRVSDEEMAFRVFRTLETLRSVYYLQRAIDHDGCDVRVFVVGGRVIGAIERSAPGWKTNLARGGRARAVTLPAAHVESALTAAKIGRAHV